VSVHEIANLAGVLDPVDLPEYISLQADKAPQSKKNEGILKARELKNNI